jgi:uncharacterized membrane protein YdjX (TVP38/TMEM64 family)
LHQDSDQEEAPTNNTSCLLFILLIVCCFVYGIINEKSLCKQLEQFLAWCKTLGILAPVLICMISTILPIIMLPVFPVMALSGPLFTEMYNQNAFLGGLIAFVSVFTGLWLGSVIAFALGKYLFKDFAARAGRKHKLLQRVNRIIASGGTKIVFMARSLPILPAEVFDYACALTGLEVWQYAIGCLGSAVPVAFWTFSSAEAADVADGGTSTSRRQHFALIGINIAALALLTLVLTLTIRQQEQDNQEGSRALNSEDVEDPSTTTKDYTASAACCSDTENAPLYQGR